MLKALARSVGPALTSGTAAPSIPSDASVATGALPAAAGGTTFGSQTEVQGMSSGVPSGVTSGVHSGVPSGVHSGVPSNTLSSAGGQGVPPTVDPTAGIQFSVRRVQQLEGSETALLR